MRLDISSPRNHFPLHEEAKHSVLIAGGIGITPIWCMAQRLKALNASFELIALARSRDHAALVEDVRALDIPVTWHFDDEHGGVPNLVSLLGRRSPDAGTHHYACGPAVMLEAFEAACRELGHSHVHQSLSFGAPALLRLLQRCDAIRRPERFEQVLQACECDARGRTGLEHRDYPQAQRLQQALKAALGVNTAELAEQAQAQGLQGLGVAKHIDAAREAAIQSALTD